MAFFGRERDCQCLELPAGIYNSSSNAIIQLVLGIVIIVVISELRDVVFEDVVFNNNNNNNNNNMCYLHAEYCYT